MKPEDFGTPLPADGRHMWGVGRPVPGWVYTYLDAEGQPLYIGVTCQPKQRFTEHRRASKWFSEAVQVRHLGPFVAKEAEQLEARMIREYQPRYNKAGKKPPALVAWLAEQGIDVHQDGAA